MAEIYKFTRKPSASGFNILYGKAQIISDYNTTEKWLRGKAQKQVNDILESFGISPEQKIDVEELASIWAFNIKTESADPEYMGEILFNLYGDGIKWEITLNQTKSLEEKIFILSYLLGFFYIEKDKWYIAQNKLYEEVERDFFETYGKRINPGFLEEKVNWYLTMKQQNDNGENYLLLHQQDIKKDENNELLYFAEELASRDHRLAARNRNKEYRFQ